jgi:hypothetical protein
MQPAKTWNAVLGLVESQTTKRRKTGVALKAELSTRIKVICMVNGNSIQRPR